MWIFRRCGTQRTPVRGRRRTGDSPPGSGPCLRAMPELLVKIAALGLACDRSGRSGPAADRDMEDAAKAEAAGRAWLRGAITQRRLSVTSSLWPPPTDVCFGGQMGTRTVVHLSHASGAVPASGLDCARGPSAKVSYLIYKYTFYYVYFASAPPLPCRPGSPSPACDLWSSSVRAHRGGPEAGD